MMRAATPAEGHVPAPTARAGWQAPLDLRFERAASRTALASRRHAGLVRVQKPLCSEDAAAYGLLAIRA
jgi:urease accessory protein UreH